MPVSSSGPRPGPMPDDPVNPDCTLLTSERVGPPTVRRGEMQFAGTAGVRCPARMPPRRSQTFTACG